MGNQDSIHSANKVKKTAIMFFVFGIVTAAQAELVSKTLPPEAEIPAHCAAVYGALLGNSSNNPAEQAYYYSKSKAMVDQAVVEAESRGVSREEARLFTANLLKQIQDTEKKQQFFISDSYKSRASNL